MKLGLRCLSIVICVSFIVSLAGCTSSSNSVASIGDEKITSTEFKFFLRTEKQNMEMKSNIALKSNSAADKKKFANEKKKFWDKEKNVSKLRKKALDSAQEFKIQLTKAKESKVTLTKDEKTNIPKQFELSLNNTYGTLAKTKEGVKADYNISLDQLKKIATDFYLIKKFVQIEMKKIVVDDASIKKEYDVNKNKYDSVTVRHILLSTTSENNKKMTGEQIKEKEKTANEILAKAKNGEDFAELAKKYSEDPGSKENGGEYTVSKTSQNRMVPEFENWALKAKQGDFGIIETQFGYHVMAFVKRTNLEDTNVKSAVKTGLQQKKYEKVISGWSKESKYKLKKDTNAINNTSMGKI